MPASTPDLERVVAVCERWQIAELSVQSAVIRAVEGVGEGARKVSPPFVASHVQIRWKAIIGTRHRLAREYSAVDLPTVWRIATVCISELMLILKPLIPTEQPPGSDGAAS